MVYVVVVVVAAAVADGADDVGSAVVAVADDVGSVVVAVVDDDTGFAVAVVDKARSLVSAAVDVDFLLAADDYDAISAVADPAVSSVCLVPIRNQSSSSCRCTRWRLAPVAAADVPPPRAVAAAVGPDSAVC